MTLFLLLAIAGAGAFAFTKLGRAEDPTFTVKVMTVTALWPGASTIEIQDQIGDRLEKRLQELTYYDRTETVVRPGLLLIKLYLKDSMPPSAVPEEFYQARKKLSDEAANLPPGRHRSATQTTNTRTSISRCTRCSLAAFPTAN